ncbi:hypothetical protein ABZ942_28015 [Nocardia sp. NPDC046473]|uniref:terpene synthase family protein n=1 Tax=Nocardia sp. NPDC046473 TaxID=3155733 RepID=UPI0033F42AEC
METKDLSSTILWDGTPLNSLIIPQLKLWERPRPYPLARNFHADSISEESYQWARERLQVSSYMDGKLRFNETNEYAAWAYPTAPPDLLRLICDANLWITVYDDVRDDQKYLAHKPTEATALHEMLSSYYSIEPKRVPDECLHNVRLRSIPELIERMRDQGFSNDQLVQFIDSVRMFGGSICSESQQDIEKRDLSLRDYIRERRADIGADFYANLSAMISGSYPGPSLQKHPIIVEMNTTLRDFALLHNDVMSLPKEMLSGSCDCAMRYLWLEKGMSVQDALYEVTDMALVAVDDFDNLCDLVELSDASPSDKRIMHHYAAGLRWHFSALAYWSCKTRRYRMDGIEIKFVTPIAKGPDKYGLRPRVAHLNDTWRSRPPDTGRSSTSGDARPAMTPGNRGGR